MGARVQLWSTTVNAEHAVKTNGFNSTDQIGGNNERWQKHSTSTLKHLVVET